MQYKMKNKKTYIKPEAYAIEMDSLMDTIINGSMDEDTSGEDFVSKGTGWDDFEDFESLDTDSYSAANWRKNNLWDTNMWD